jgi:glycerol-3-phosphate dehydrogenase subunit B
VTSVVVGSGMAGSMAALSLAERGVDVVQVAGGYAATALCGGSLDVAAASPGVSYLPWRDPLQGRPLKPVERLRLLLAEAPTHPYSILFGSDEARAVAELTSAIDRLRSWLEPSGIEIAGDLEHTRVLPNLPGTVRVADFVVSGPADADLGAVSEVVWIDVPGLEGWDPSFSARTLAHELEALGIAVPAQRVERPEWPEGLIAPRAGRLAPRLDRAEGRAAMAALLAGRGARDRLLLLPPILGVDHTAAIVRELAEVAGGPVAEALGHAPHATAGFRLQRALDRATDSLTRREQKVASIREAEDGWQLRLADSSELECDALVLATGRYVGGGLATEETVREPLLGIPLFDEDGRRVDGIPAHRSVRKGYGNPQPLYSAGVRVDAEMRPLTARGEVRSDRLFVAGDLIGGFDPARERTGMGVAVASATRAAAAVERVARGAAT